MTATFDERTYCSTCGEITTWLKLPDHWECAVCGLRAENYTMAEAIEWIEALQRRVAKLQQRISEGHWMRTKGYPDKLGQSAEELKERAEVQAKTRHAFKGETGPTYES